MIYFVQTGTTKLLKLGKRWKVSTLNNRKTKLTNLFSLVNFRSSSCQSLLHLVHHRSHAHAGAQARPLFLPLPDGAVARTAAAACAAAAVLGTFLSCLAQLRSLESSC